MRFWLTLIIATIGISASLTWLVMHQGAQALPNLVTAAAKTEPPEIVMEGVTMMANVIPVSAPDCTVGKASTFSIPFKNTGKGPLTIGLVRTSCGCVHEISVNDNKLEQEKEPAVVPPGGSGILKFSWTPKPEQAKTPKLTISADLLINDPRPEFASAVRLEISTHVQAAE